MMKSKIKTKSEPLSAANLNARTKNISKQFADQKHDENLARLKNFEVVQKMLVHLPLQYLYSKLELRRYALERAANRFVKLHRVKVKNTYRDVFNRWKQVERKKEAEDHHEFELTTPHVSFEKKFGIMVLAAAFTELGKKLLLKKFHHWMKCYCSKYNSGSGLTNAVAATEIQRWIRHLKVVKSGNFRKWTDAVQVCMHRRKSIKYVVKFELIRRVALAKLKTGVTTKRRFFYAARALQRQYRWLLLFRKVKYRLIRVIAVRRLQRWRRMCTFRTPFDKLVMRLVIRCGGYTLVYDKVPQRFLDEFAHLKAIDELVSCLQKAWFKSCGKLALFEKFAQRKKEMAYQQMLDDNAVVIQRSYRAHLWDMLMLAAMQNNRARRVQRGFRAHVYRVWVWERLMLRRDRFARIIQKIMKQKYKYNVKLERRFVKRKEKIEETRRVCLISAEVLQRAWRCVIAVRHVKKLKEIARFEKIRKNVNYLHDCASKIQLNWRRNKPPYRFPRHVRLLMTRLELYRRKNLWKKAFIIQKLARVYVTKQLAVRKARTLDAVGMIYRLAKAYCLKAVIFYRVVATRLRRLEATEKLRRNMRTLLWLKALRIKFALRKVETDYKKMRNICATIIQVGLRTRVTDYNMPVRVAGRRQLQKRREKEAYEAHQLLINTSAAYLQKAFRGNMHWRINMRLIKFQRKELNRLRGAKKIQRWTRAMLIIQRYNDRTLAKFKLMAAERRKQQHIKCANTLGFYYKRYREGLVLGIRFANRKKMLDEYKRLMEERRVAEEEKRLADEEVQRTEENMAATVAASWKQGADTQGRNYYYNFVTGESRWEPPDNWVMKPLDTWIRQKDERGNVYYFNQQTDESRWLPPCSICGDEAEKWCADCAVAYCEKDFDELHGEDSDEVMKAHIWSAVELDKDVLQPGEVYCLECKRRRASRMCTTCWDPYCDECFKYVHRSGALRFHKSMAYRRAKQGWMCVKGRMEGEKDYYVHGQSGETSYEKPEELMTADELVFYKNFKTHKDASEEHVKKINTLQFELEAVSYERDTILFDQLKGAGVQTDKKKSKGKDSKVAAGDLITNALKKGPKGLLNMLTGAGGTQAYRQNILKPDNRSRGKHRSDMIQGLLEGADSGGGK